MDNITQKHVILIDDDPIINLISKKIISLKYDFPIDAYTQAPLALAYLTDEVQNVDLKPQFLIFLDINMPTMDGWEFLHEFEKLPDAFLARCRIFMLTSSIDLEDIAKSKKYKTVHNFISKPLSQDKIKMLEAQ